MKNHACSTAAAAILIAVAIGTSNGCSASGPAERVVGIEQKITDQSSLVDFYYQDVCNDGAGNDPYSCQGNSRNINIDEPVQYLLTDSNGAQATVSVPIRLGSGNPGDPTGVLHIFDYSAGEHGNSSFLEFNTAGGPMSAINPDLGWPNDGWDVMEYNGGFASYIGTADPVTRVANWVHATGPGTCVFDDSWLLWDQNRVEPGVVHGAVGALNNGGGMNGAVAGICQTGDRNNSAPTSWTQQNFCYDSGKCMDSLVSWHNGAAEGAREVFYYTKPYGRTRWEAWSCPDHVNCQMVDHRDWSFYRGALDGGGWFPAFQVPTYYPQAKGNWLAGGDFGMASEAWDGGGYFNWNRMNAPNWAYVTESTAGVHNGNHYLAVSTTQGGWSSVSQDVPAQGASPGWYFAFGLRALASNPGDTGYVIVRVWELGTPYYHDITFTPNAGDRSVHHDFFRTQGTPSAFRFEFYFSPNFNGWIDDAFLTQT